ncbi:serine/arginine repetitive matrix protein 2-like isoform X32 [Lineus longissimus]|uniref:serine/arginine repetitive matrix protein 2-like isoform X32 n=1 Tax=Lineus longissimus TaxID=88925 RepID=UPI00315C8299
MAVSPQIKMAYIVTLYGGTPWGFRIHGGIDSNEPIRISKVNPNSKSFREGVQVGDIIYKINGDVVDGLTLVEAQRHIKAVGNTLELELKRGEDGVEGQGTGEANKENKVRGQPKQTTKQEDDMFKSSTSISINHHPSGAEHNDTAAQENAARAERARMRLQRREASRQQQQQLQHSSERGRPFYRSFTPQPDSRSMGTSRGIGRSDSVESLPVYTMHVPDSVANYCTIRPKPRVNEWKPMSKYGSVSRSYKPVSFNKGADSLSNRSGSSQSSGMTMGLDSLIAKEREFENLANFDEPVTNNVPNSSHSAPSDNEWWRRRESASRDEQSSKGAKMFMKMQEKSRVEEDVEPPQSPWRNQTQEAPHQQGYHSHQQPQQQPSGPWRSQSVEGPQQGYQSQESQPQQQRPSSPWRNQSFDGPQQHPPSQWRNQSNDLQKRPVSPMRNQTIPQQHQQPSSPMRNQSYGAPQSRRPVSPVRNQSAPQQHQRPTSPMKNQSYDSTQRQRPSSPWRSQSFDVPERQRPMSPMSQQRPSSPWMNKPSETKHMTSWQSQPQEAKPPMQTPLSPCRSRTHETPVSQPPTPRPATRSSSVPARARSAPSTPRGQPPKSTQPPSAVVPPMPSGVPVPVNRAPTPAQSEAEEEVVPVKDRIKSFRNIEAAQSPTKQQQKFSTDYNPKPNFSSQPSTPTWNVRAPSPVSFNKHSSGAPTPSTPSSSAPWSKPTSTWVPTKPPSTPTWSGQSQTLPRDFHRSDSLPPPSLDPVPLTMNWKKREEEKNVKNLGAEDDVWRSASRDFLTMTIPKSQKVDSRLQQNGTSDYPSTSEAPVLKASQSSLNAAPKSNLLDSKPGIWTPGQRPPDLSNDLDERERDNERDKERINELKSANKTWTPSGTLPKDFRSRKLESSEPVKFEPPPVKFESVAPREPPKSEPLPPREPPAAQPSVKASSLPEFVEVAGIKYWREPEVAASKSEENHAPPPERAFSTPSLPASTSLAHSPSKPFSTMNGSISSLDGRHSPTLHLPKTQTPAITLLQKYRDEEASTKPPPDTHPSISDGQIPKGAIYVGSKDHVDGEVKHTDTYYILPSGEKQVTSTKTEKKAPKYEGIGPTNEAGLPIAFRSTIDEKNQHDWYKTFYKTLHKTDKPRPGDLFRNEGVFVNSKEEEENTYRPTYTFPEDEPTPFKKEAEEENPYVPSYAKLPQNSKDDSYSTLERDRMKSYTHEAYGSKGSSTWSPAHARSKLEIYKNQPRKIEDYEPGYSSIADKEIQTKKAYLNKLEKFKAEKVYDIQRSEKDFPDESTFYNPPIEKPGQNSQYILDPDRRLPTKNSERSSRSTSPTQAHEWYKQVLKGGEIPQEGFRRPYPERKDDEEDFPPQQNDQKSPSSRAYEKYLHQDHVDSRSLERPKSKNKPAPPPKKHKPVPPPKTKSAAERLGIKSPPPFNLKASQRHHHSTSDLPSHKSPVGTLERHHSSTLDRRRRDEEEARRKEYLRQITEEEKRKRAEEEYARNEARKHSDFFSAKQKSPIPIDRFGEDLENMAPMHVPKFDKKHRPTEIKGKAKALYSFKSQSQKELSFRKGDVIYLTRQVDKNWYEGEHHGHRGIFPVNYVEITKTLEEARAIALSQEGTAKIKYTFKKQSPVELSAKKGAIATLIRRVDENWYEAKVDGIQGIIPISYLDIQREPDTPFITPAPSVVQSAAPSAFNTPGPGTPVRPMSPLYPDQMMSPSQNRENYFDFQDYSPRQDRRQRYDSSSKDGDYNQTLDSFIDTLDKRDSTSHRQDHSPTKRDGHRNVSQDYNPRLDAASAMIETYKLQQKEKESRPAYDRTLSLDRRSMGRDGYYRDKEGPPPPQPKHEQPLKPYRAVFAYGPQNQDELDLREGDSVYVLERCDDGWFVGTNARTGQFGTFPGNYVQPV